MEYSQNLSNPQPEADSGCAPVLGWVRSRVRIVGAQGWKPLFYWIFHDLRCALRTQKFML